MKAGVNESMATEVVKTGVNESMATEVVKTGVNESMATELYAVKKGFAVSFPLIFYIM